MTEATQLMKKIASRECATDSKRIISTTEEQAPASEAGRFDTRLPPYRRWRHPPGCPDGDYCSGNGLCFWHCEDYGEEA